MRKTDDRFASPLESPVPNEARPTLGGLASRARQTGVFGGWGPKIG